MSGTETAARPFQGKHCPEHGQVQGDMVMCYIPMENVFYAFMVSDSPNWGAV